MLAFTLYNLLDRFLPVSLHMGFCETNILGWNHASWRLNG